MIKVSIVVVTYNHEKFIEQALHSILNQKVSFNYEILVIDDNSTDKTNEIVQSLAASHSQIKHYKSEQNKGVRNSAFLAFDLIQGEYTAFLDGDDFWNSTEKLQSQIDFLDGNKEYSGAFHDANIINEVVKGEQYFHLSKLYSQRYYYKESLFFSDIISRIVIIPSASLIVRTVLLKNVNLNYFTDNYSIEWKLLSLVSKEGRLHYFNEVWSTYRNHDQGISKSNKEKFHLSHIQFCRMLLKDEHFNEYHLELRSAISHELKILLDNKEIHPSIHKKKLFRQYFWNEFKRMLELRRRVIRV